MATASVLKGFAVIAKMGTSQEGAIGSKSSTLTLGTETQDITTKDDAEGGVLYKNTEVSGRTATLKCNGLVFSGSDNLAFDAGDTIETVEFTCGKRKYSFKGLVTNLEYSGDVEGIASWDATIESIGAITKTAVS